MFPALPDDIWRYVKSFVIHDPYVAMVKRKLNREIRGSFYTYTAGSSECKGIFRRYYYLMSPVGQKCMIDYM